MNARQVLALARAHGIGIRKDGERLSLEAAEAPPAAVLAAIREARPELLLLLGDEGEAAQQQQSTEEADALRLEAIAAEREEIEQQRLFDDWIESTALALDPPNPGSPSGPAEARLRRPDESGSAPNRREAARVEIRRRPPSWADVRDVPRPGDCCNCCHGSAWWAECGEPQGWRCRICHPPPHAVVRQVRT